MSSKATKAAHRIVDTVLIILLLSVFFVMANWMVVIVFDTGLSTIKRVFFAASLVGLSLVIFLMLRTVAKNLFPGGGANTR